MPQKEPLVLPDGGTQLQSEVLKAQTDMRARNQPGDLRDPSENTGTK